MRFITNRIPTNKSGSFSDLVEKVASANRQQVKTASADKNVKAAQTTEAANDDNELRTDVHHGEGSANDQNGEPEVDGENKTVDPAGLKAASTEDADEEAKTASDSEEEEITEAATDADDSEEEEVTEASAEGKTKVAESEGDSGPAKGEGAGDSSEDLEGKNEGRFPEPDRESGECYTQEAEEDGKADVESSVKAEVREALAAAKLGNVTKLANLSDEGRKLAQSTFEKVANLKPKQKAWLKNYYRMVWPEEYSDSLVQDK